ncbi:NACHT domain-containing protein [Hassallia byssoidea VB512170]|uniref:NACHT domain-containing protein n=1 Tax=Hassallia byssoidea VB512170 TaxID=1304833 RepID=A0A846H6B2_9CYAN|nr:HEAT repeat domain-containing protein [Hassalia byssoidea]NEU72906.1 NACHT domain-containing protein [Hassalia byssoidea VB512170]
MSNEFWDKTDELGLVKFVNFARESEAVKQFIQNSHLPASGFDSHSKSDNLLLLIEEIYNALCQQNIEYDLNEYFHSWIQDKPQKIRPAEVLLNNRQGTCLDLAILFCAICCHFDLLPILILVNGHALAAVSLMHRFRDWENDGRGAQELFWQGLGTLKDKEKLKKIIKNKEYLAVECTGFAHSETLPGNGDCKRENGFLSFKNAVKCGKQQIEKNELRFALDIPMAYNFWLPKVFKERLDQDLIQLKRFNNDKNLNEIYVSLGLIEREKDAQPKPSENSVNPTSSDFNKPEKGKVVREYKNDEFFDEVLKKSDSTNNQGKRLLIIGDPGGGKSTLLRKIADWVLVDYEKGFPIWIYLAKFNNELVKDEDVSDPGWLYKHLSEQWLRNLSQEGRETPEKWKDKFEELLKTRQIWLLLDGADEMAVSYPLKKIQEQLTKGWANSVSIVMSCRLNLWEQQKDTLNEKFDIYRTLDFSYPEQVHQFISNWFGNDNSTAKELQDKLEEKNRERLRNLVKNPLRLALLCRIWKEGSKTLPETKAGFYQLLVNKHYQWKDDANEKFKILVEKKEEEPNKTTFEKLNIKLGELAIDAIDNSDFRFRLRENFIEKYLGNPNVENTPFWWALNLGWLLDIGYPSEEEKNLGEKVYAFFHPTFQEYFAATAVESYDFFLPESHKDRPVKDKFYRIFEPQWKEPILLWLGRSDVDDNLKNEFIQKLINFKSGCGDFYLYRAYFLAAAGLAEFESCKKAEEIVKTIVKWYFQEETWRYRANYEEIREEAKTALLQTNRKKAIATLVDVILNPQYEYRSEKAPYFLGEIGAGNKDAINALVYLTHNGRDYHDVIRGLAAISLGKIGAGDKDAIAALVELIGKSSGDTCWRAVESLGEIGVGNSDEIAALIKLIQDQETRRRAVESSRENGKLYIWEPSYHNGINAAFGALQKIGVDNSDAIAALVELIGNPQYREIHKQAVNSLEKICTRKKDAIAALTQALVKLTHNPQDEDTCRQVAESLGKIDSRNSDAIAALVELTRNAQNEDTRREAAESLEKIDPGNKDGIPALVKLTRKAQYEGNRKKAAESLVKIGVGKKDAIDVLVYLTHNAQDEDTRREAAEFLEKIDPGNKDGIPALVKLILNTQDTTNIRRRAAYSLWKIGANNPDAIAALVELIRNAQNEDIRKKAAENLYKISADNKDAIAALVHLIGNAQNEDTRRTAVESLGRIGADNGADNKDAIAALVHLIGNAQNEDTRKQAVESLAKIDPGNKDAITALVHLMDKSSGDTRRRAVNSLGEIGAGDKDAIAALVQFISNPPDKAARWQAEYAANSLGKIGAGDKDAIAALVKLTCNTQRDGNYTPERAASSLKNILITDQIPLVVTKLKNYSKSYPSSYSIIWHCAQSLSYPCKNPRQMGTGLFCRSAITHDYF